MPRPALRKPADGPGAQRRSESCARWIPWDIGEGRQPANGNAAKRKASADVMEPA